MSLCLYVSACLCFCFNMSVFVSVHVSMLCICLCVCMYLQVTLCVYVSLNVCLCVCMYVWMCLSMCIYMSVSLCVSECIYTCVSIYVNVCLSVWGIKVPKKIEGMILKSRTENVRAFPNKFNLLKACFFVCLGKLTSSLLWEQRQQFHPLFCLSVIFLQCWFSKTFKTWIYTEV